MELPTLKIKNIRPKGLVLNPSGVRVGGEVSTSHDRTLPGLLSHGLFMLRTSGSAFSNLRNIRLQSLGNLAVQEGLNMVNLRHSNPFGGVRSGDSGNPANTRTSPGGTEYGQPSTNEVNHR